MSTMTTELPAHLQETTKILATTDILRATRLLEELKDRNRIILFLDDYYALCSHSVTAVGGEIIKYMGDACLALFPPEAPLDALQAVADIRRQFPALCKAAGVSVTDVKAALHIGEVVVGPLGPEGYRDVLGSAVNTLFRIEGQGRVTLSETLYRKLPSDQRGPWHKQSAPTVYCLEPV